MEPAGEIGQRIRDEGIIGLKAWGINARDPSSPRGSRTSVAHGRAAIAQVSGAFDLEVGPLISAMLHRRAYLLVAEAGRSLHDQD